MKNFLFTLLLTCSLSFAQDADKIKKIGNEACKCTEKIDVELPKDSIISNINTCIYSQILKEQVDRQVGDIKKLLESAEVKVENGDTTLVVGGNKDNVIVIDENFDEIQAYMFQNCEAVKYLMNVNNNKHNNSLSKNKKALAHYEEGQQYSAREQHDLALVCYNKAVKADPKFAFAWDNLGISHRKLGNFKEAIKCYEKSLALDPKGTVPLQNMAVAYEYLKDYKNAGETYTKFIAVHPNDPEGYYGAGRTFFLSDDYAKGADYMFKAYLLYTEQKSPYINDAMTNLQEQYTFLKEKGKLDIFLEAAKKNNVKINE
jgi:tetratricopeptide (TPR) repeat protein